MLVQPGQRVLEQGKIRRVVLGKFGGAQKRCLCSKLSGDRGNLLGIRGDDGTRDDLRLSGGRDGIRDQRIARKIPNVLARDALRSAAGGDDGQYVSHKQSLQDRSILGSRDSKL